MKEKKDAEEINENKTIEGPNDNDTIGNTLGQQFQYYTISRTFSKVSSYSSLDIDTVDKFINFFPLFFYYMLSWQSSIVILSSSIFFLSEWRLMLDIL